MEKHFSLYLDSVRFLASLFVVFAHYFTFNIIGRDMVHVVPDLGREAVMIFFVLSGYVIAYTSAVKQQTIREYVVMRSARIYSVALPVLLLAFLLAFFTEWFLGKDLSFHYQIVKPYIYLPFSALFLGELWNFSEVPGWLGSYWSLGYEVWYYVFFACLYFFRGYRRIVVSLVVFAILGFKLWLLLPIWMSGVALYHWQGKVDIPKNIARLGWLVTLLCLVAYKHFDCEDHLRSLGVQIWPFHDLKLGSADRYLSDYVICLVVLCNFYFARYAKFISLEKFQKMVRTVSSYTFTLYLVHALVLSMWKYYYVNDPHSFMDIALVSFLIGLTTYALGMLTEHRKSMFAHFFDTLYGAVANLLQQNMARMRQFTLSKK